MVLSKIGDNRGHKSSPGFVQRGMDANGPAIGKVGGIVPFVQKDRFRFLPRRGGLAQDPHNDEQVPKRPFKGVWHDANQLVGDAIRARAFVVPEMGNHMLESVCAEHIW
jgi:hypothetical protein